jgi:hypothetical protein
VHQGGDGLGLQDASGGEPLAAGQFDQVGAADEAVEALPGPVAVGRGGAAEPGRVLGDAAVVGLSRVAIAAMQAVGRAVGGEAEAGFGGARP